MSDHGIYLRAFKFGIRSLLAARVTSSTAMGLKRGIKGCRPLREDLGRMQEVSQRHTQGLATHSDSIIEPEDRKMVAA